MMGAAAKRDTRCCSIEIYQRAIGRVQLGNQEDEPRHDTRLGQSAFCRPRPLAVVRLDARSRSSHSERIDARSGWLGGHQVGESRNSPKEVGRGNNGLHHGTVLAVSFDCLIFKIERAMDESYRFPLDGGEGPRLARARRGEKLGAPVDRHFPFGRQIDCDSRRGTDPNGRGFVAQG